MRIEENELYRHKCLISYINPNDNLHDKAVKLLDEIGNERYVSELTIIKLYSVFS